MTDVVARQAASAIVLAGGRSTRFGSDKLAAEIDGRPLLHHAIAAVAEAVREVVVVVARDAAEPVLPSGIAIPIHVVHDAEAGRGPVAGVAAGLAAARQPLAILVGGDQPRLVPDLLAELLRRCSSEGGAPVDSPADSSLDAPADYAVDAIALEEDGRLRPLPCALRVPQARTAAEHALATGGGSLVGFLGRLRVAVVAPEVWRLIDPTGASLADVDRPEDMARGSAGPPAPREREPRHPSQQLPGKA